MIRVLFICRHNSARSQMAEAYLRQLGGDEFEVESAGIEPGELNSYIIEIMKEDGIDISNHTTNDVFKFFQEERRYDMIISVCSPEVDKQCPIFPGKALRMNWPFADPAQFEGDREEVLAFIRPIRDEIKHKIESLIADYRTKGLKLFLAEAEQ